MVTVRDRPNMSDKDRDMLNSEITPGQRMISSCAGAIMTSIFMTPLDVVKIRMQAQQKALMKNKCFLYCNGLMDHLCICGEPMTGKGNGTMNHNSSFSLASKSRTQCIFRSSKNHNQFYHHQCGTISLNAEWYQRPGQFNGTMDAFVKIARNEGLPSLWSGLPPTLVMAIPATVIYFTLYDHIRETLIKQTTKTEQPIWISLVSGAGARVFAATTISPLEMIRTKMQSERMSYNQIGNALVDLVKKNGWLSLWRGLGPTLLRDVPFSSLYWANYEMLKQKFNQKEPTVAFSFVSGAAAGTVSAVLTLPFDVVKTHRQTELGEQQMKASFQQSKSRTSTFSILNKIYNQHGVKGLFAGIVPRIIKVAPACAIMITSYEYGKSFFREYNYSKRNNVAQSYK